MPRHRRILRIAKKSANSRKVKGVTLPLHSPKFHPDLVLPLSGFKIGFVIIAIVL